MRTTEEGLRCWENVELELEAALCMSSARYIAVCCGSYIFKIYVGFQFIPKMSRHTYRTYAMLTTKLVVTAFIWKLLNHWVFRLCISRSP